MSISPLDRSIENNSAADCTPPLNAVFAVSPDQKSHRRRGNYAQIRQFDVANGPGIRVSIFVTGCTHNCPGCFNASYQDFHFGQPWTDTTTDELAQMLESPMVSGLTLLGGEPMQNLWLTEVVAELRARAVLPPVSQILATDSPALPTLSQGLENASTSMPYTLSKNVWVYSGYTYEQITAHRGRHELLEQCDVLVDGLFVQRLLDLRLKFRGSSNQRIIDIPRSLKAGQPVLYPLD